MWLDSEAVWAWPESPRKEEKWGLKTKLAADWGIASRKDKNHDYKEKGRDVEKNSRNTWEAKRPCSTSN